MKRIVCVLLTLIMLLSLVPMGASAAGKEVSQAAITILKQFEKFEDDCWKGDNKVAGKDVYYTGYGTVCNEEHVVEGGVLKHEKKDGNVAAKVTQTAADEALKAALKVLDDQINAFSTTSGKALTQSQHDALVIFSFDAGAGWISGSGVVRNAILNGGDINDLLNAFANWGGGYSDRRKVEVNMYVNGIYSSSVPTSYTEVVYDANGGSMAQGSTYTMHFDSSKTLAHPVTPTRAGYKFLGWYNKATAPTKRYNSLTKSCATNGTVYAQWQANNVTAKNADTKATEVDFSLKASELVVKRMYKTPSVSAKYATLKATSVSVTKEFVDGNGYRWGYIGGTNPWVLMSGSVAGETTTGDTAAFQIKVTVTNSYVNRRVNATAASTKNGTYNQGDELLIINEDDGWGQVGEVQSDGKIKAVGWVSLVYTNWGSVQDGAADNSGSTAVVATATVTYNGYLNIRSEANTDSKIVGALAKNDTVDIYETKTVDGHQWGRCQNGWICLTYANVTKKVGSDAAVSTGAEAYIYSGKLVDNTKLYTDAVASTATQIAKASRPADTKDKVKVLELKADNAGNTWAKLLWYVDKDKDKKGIKEAAVTGWTEMSNFNMDAAIYTVSAEELNVRNGAGTENESFFTLAKGVQVKVTEVKLAGESIWGRVPAHDQSGKEAWINLSTKYVTRGDSIKIENSASSTTGKIGTVVNADSLRVRKTGAIYGQQIGSLSRGTTVAVWEEDDGWYKVDSNKNGTYDYNEDGWVSGNYLDVREGTAGGNSTVTDAAGNKYETDGTGKGVVANTYAGVNVRTGPSTAYASNGKLLPGTIVDILEVSGNGKWGRTAQGWVSLDYITMLSYNEALNNALTGGNSTTGGVQVESFDKADKVTKTAVFTGKIGAGVKVYNDADTNATVLRTTADGENITIHELATVKTVVSEQVGSTGTDANGEVTTVTTTETTYWARINDGWIQTTAGGITLNALDEKVHTLTGKDEITIAGNKIKKGEQVKVTKLLLSQDTVMGLIETKDGSDWADLSFFSEGVVYEAPQQNTNTSTNTNTGTGIVSPVIGNGSSVGGYVTNTSGYRYTGKVIRANELKVRATPSTAASVTTTLKNGQALVVYETTIADNMAWGRCDAGWVYLYYVDLTPVVNGAVDARVVYNDNTVIYTDANCSAVAGTYSRMSTIDIYEIVGKMARTEQGWVNVDNLL